MPTAPEPTLRYAYVSVCFSTTPYGHYRIGAEGSVTLPQLQNSFVDEGDKDFKGSKIEKHEE